MMVNTDKCKKIQDILADYRTNALSPRLVKNLEDHLACCPDCASELQTLDHILEILDANTPEYEPPTGLWNGVHNAITSGQAKRNPLSDVWNWWRKPARLITTGTLTAAAAIIISLTHSPRAADTVPQAISNSEYVQAHALYAGQMTTADRVSYLAVAAASDNIQTQ